MVNITVNTQNQELCHTTTIPALDNSSSGDRTSDFLVPKTFKVFILLSQVWGSLTEEQTSWTLTLHFLAWLRLGAIHHMCSTYPPGILRTTEEHKHISAENASLLDAQTVQLFSSQAHRKCCEHLCTPKGKGCQSRRSPLEPRDTHLWQEELTCERRFISAAL